MHPRSQKLSEVHIFFIPEKRRKDIMQNLKQVIFGYEDGTEWDKETLDHKSVKMRNSKINLSFKEAEMSGYKNEGS